MKQSQDQRQLKKRMQLKYPHPVPEMKGLILPLIRQAKLKTLLLYPHQVPAKSERKRIGQFFKKLKKESYR